MPPEHLPDSRAGTTNKTRQARRAEVGLATGAQDRLLLGGRQPPWLPKRPRGAIHKRRVRAAAIKPAMPPTVRCRRRHPETGTRLPQRHPPIDRSDKLAPTSQSELGISVQIHHGSPSGGMSGRTRTASKEGRMHLSAV